MPAGGCRSIRRLLRACRHIAPRSTSPQERTAGHLRIPVRISNTPGTTQVRSCDFRHIQVCGASHTESALNAHTECVHMRDESSRARCVAHWHELCSTLSNESHCKIAEKRVIRGYVSHAHSRHAQRCAVRLTPRVAATFLHSNFSAGQCCAWTHRTGHCTG